jgi:putative endonuclease
METQMKNTKIIGDYGEKIAANYLKKKGFVILAVNYWRKWGELDIVAKKDSIVHFVEVKTVSYETKEKLKFAVSCGTWRPEEQVHQFKLRQIGKALQTWISERSYEGDWQIDVVAVRLVVEDKYATVNYIENIVAG